MTSRVARQRQLTKPLPRHGRIIENEPGQKAFYPAPPFSKPPIFQGQIGEDIGRRQPDLLAKQLTLFDYHL